MPTRFVLTLDTVQSPSAPVTVNQTHAFACELLERSVGADHHGLTKSFAIGPLIDHPDEPDRRALVLNWLDDSRPVERVVGAVRHLRFGSFHGAVAHCDIRRGDYERLRGGWVHRAWRWRFLSPTWFDLRGGRRLPLPDPTRILTSLVLRWNAMQPAVAGTQLEDAAVRALLADVVVANVDISMGTLPLRTRAGVIEQRAGFVGRVDLHVARTSAPTSAGLLSTLSRFAEFAGVGAQTTHGFGFAWAEPLRP